MTKKNGSQQVSKFAAHQLANEWIRAIYDIHSIQNHNNYCVG